MAGRDGARLPNGLKPSIVVGSEAAEWFKALPGHHYYGGLAKGSEAAEWSKALPT